MTQPPSIPRLHKPPHRWPVVLIGLGKLFKAACLILLAIGLHYLIAPAWHNQIADFIDALRVDPHNEYLMALLQKIMDITPDHLKLLRIGSSIYAALYLLEGIGLLYDKHWAEWLTIITTAGFIPLEIYEIRQHVTVVRVIIFILNIIVLCYLIFRLHRQAQIKREHKILAAVATPPVPSPQSH